MSRTAGRSGSWVGSGRDVVVKRNPIFPVSNEEELCTRNAALGLEHVQEMILGHMDTHTLKKARLVSRRWQLLAANELRHQLQIDIYLPTDSSEALNDPQSRFNKLELIMNASPGFPCSSFLLYTNQFTLPHIQNLLAAIGPYVQSLYLQMDFGDDLGINNPWTWQSFTQMQLMSHLSKLFTEQAPNLNSLRLKILVPPFWMDQIREWDADEEERFFPDPDPDQPNSPLKLKLKHLIIETPFPGKAFAEIMDAAGNLKSVSLLPWIPPANYEIGPAMEYFIDGGGQTRIKLFKQFIFRPSFETISLSERLVRRHSEQLFFEFLKFGRLDLKPFTETIPNYKKRVKDVIGNLLGLSAGSLKKLIIPHFQCFSKVTIPLLPKLEHLEFKDCFHCYEIVLGKKTEKRSWLRSSNTNKKEARNFLPLVFKIISKCPALKSIDVTRECYFVSNLTGSRHSTYPRELFEMTEPVSTVERIRIHKTCKISESTFQIMSNIFPNAHISGFNK